ncbi:hypothetical protein DVR12_19850 [Chitinophaga silvatica]|uniref:Uncharacterized protein n=2 Tax=Chitinophaga silvatica TaxID=2282649 RepID=A0A3E1Y5I8_9BACT|nr:hypothetical protein DVR12_19850 [Chitinophaga silvatica]
MNGNVLLPETIYARNISGENFIEFRFDSGTKRLYEITLVAIQNNTVKLLEDRYISTKVSINNEFFNCYIDEDSDSEISLPMQILRSETSISIFWSINDLNYYSVSENCLIGVDRNNFLCSISIMKLSKEELFEIFGF